MIWTLNILKILFVGLIIKLIFDIHIARSNELKILEIAENNDKLKKLWEDPEAERKTFLGFHFRRNSEIKLKKWLPIMAFIILLFELTSENKLNNQIILVLSGFIITYIFFNIAQFRVLSSKKRLNVKLIELEKIKKFIKYDLYACLIFMFLIKIF